MFHFVKGKNTHGIIWKNTYPSVLTSYTKTTRGSSMSGQMASSRPTTFLGTDSVALHPFQPGNFLAGMDGPLGPMFDPTSGTAEVGVLPYPTQLHMLPALYTEMCLLRTVSPLGGGTTSFGQTCLVCEGISAQSAHRLSKPSGSPHLTPFYPPPCPRTATNSHVGSQWRTLKPTALKCHMDGASSPPGTSHMRPP